MQKSIEVEYWVIDRNGDLTPPGPLAEHSEQVEEEFVEPLFELKTPPCETVAELRRTFVDQLSDVLSRADDLEKRLVPFGTPINGEPIDRWPGERGRIQEEVVGSNFDFAKYCAGTHVHFEQRNVVDQLNALIALDPALALCNSSPYLQGEWVADGARAYCYRKLGYADFPKHGQLWHYVDTVAEWHRRLDRRYEEFEAAAVEAGVDADVFAEHFSPDDVVWTPVRLREEMPTVEWRSPDATLPSQLLRLVETVDAVMEALHHTNVRVVGDPAGGTDGRIECDSDEKTGGDSDEKTGGDSGGGTGDEGDGEPVCEGDGKGNGGAPDPISEGLSAVENGDAIDGGRAGVTEDAIVLPEFEALCDLVGAAMHEGMRSEAVVDYLERMGFPTDEFHPISSRIDGREYVTRGDARDLRLEYASRLEEDVDELVGSVES